MSYKGLFLSVSIALFITFLSGCSVLSDQSKAGGNLSFSNALDPVALSTLQALQQQTAKQRLAAVNTLLIQFQQSWSSGKTLMALNALQRAAQIDASDALIYYDMSVIRLYQHHCEEAKQLALLARSYARHQVMEQAAQLLLMHIKYRMVSCKS